jgi:hypothetical protein
VLWFALTIPAFSCQVEYLVYPQQQWLRLLAGSITKYLFTLIAARAIRCPNMSRSLVFFSLLPTMLFCTAVASETSGKEIRFSGPECSSHPAMKDGAVTCTFLGSRDGIPTYSLLFGRTGKSLIEFIRSAEVITDQ